MAGELSDFAQNGLGDHLTQKANFPFAAQTRWFGISTADPGEDGSGNQEPFGTSNYSRAQIVGADWAVATGRQITNALDSDQWANGGFPELTAPGITGATHWTLWNDPVLEGPNNFLGRAVIPGSPNFDPNSTPIIEAGKFVAAFSSGGLVDRVARLLLEHLMLKTEWNTGGESRWAYLSTTNPTDAGTGITEPIAASYGRAPAPQSAFNAFSAGGTNNANDPIAFPKALESWGNQQYSGLYDDQTTGDILTYFPLGAALDVTVNERVIFGTGDYQYTID